MLADRSVDVTESLLQRPCWRHGCECWYRSHLKRYQHLVFVISTRRYAFTLCADLLVYTGAAVWTDFSLGGRTCLNTESLLGLMSAEAFR